MEDMIISVRYKRLEIFTVMLISSSLQQKYSHLPTFCEEKLLVPRGSLENFCSKEAHMLFSLQKDKGDPFKLSGQMCAIWGGRLGLMGVCNPI